ncbi:hypothetical protein BH09PAT3_BH09PAT3_0220 [soil metagenome]
MKSLEFQPAKSLPLPNGIMHGPYEAMPAEMLTLYTSDPERFGAYPDMPLDQFIHDRESEWQWDQHSQAVAEACDAGRIDRATASIYIEKLLRPWFVYFRREGEPVPLKSQPY